MPEFEEILNQLIAKTSGFLSVAGFEAYGKLNAETQRFEFFLKDERGNFQKALSVNYGDGILEGHTPHKKIPPKTLKRIRSVYALEKFSIRGFAKI